MLDRMTPAEFRERMQADKLDPIDESWLQTGVIVAALRNTLWEIAASFAGRRLQDHQYRKPTDFMPKVDMREEETQQANQASLDKFQAQMAATYGGNR